MNGIMKKKIVVEPGDAHRATPVSTATKTTTTTTTTTTIRCDGVQAFAAAICPLTRQKRRIAYDSTRQENIYFEV